MADDYLTEIYNARLILQHKPNGDCIYLDRKVGCSIHGNAPAICKEFDCRRIYKKIKYNKKLLARMPKGFKAAAKRLLKKGRLA